MGATLLNKSVLASSSKKNITLGVQLYSVRDAMAKDPVATLRKLATFGYTNVEHANYIMRKFYGFGAKEFKKILDALSLKMISGHTVFGVQHWDESSNDFSDSWKYTIEDAATLNQSYVISPWLDEKMRNSYDNLKRYLEIFNKCGELCKKSGMKFGYHNHDFEFEQTFNGETIFDIMMKNIDPELVVIQLDIGNMFNGGAKALDVLKKYPNRFENIHIKDEIKASKEGKDVYESTLLGKGIINCKDVADLAFENGGAKVFIIEQEAYQGKDPLECLKENLETMKKWGY
jgi:sugar phosphate isomerase/epimerase